MNFDQLYEYADNKTRNTIAVTMGLTLNEIGELLEKHGVPEVNKIIEIYFRSKYGETILKGM